MKMLIDYEIELVLLLFCWKNCVCKLESNVVGGNYTEIESFPHSAALYIYCPFNKDRAWICGSSILTEKVLLTAAHCLEECSPPNIVAQVGNIDRDKGIKHLGVISYMHENYTNLEEHDDLALIGLARNLKFNDKVKRVIILKKPPTNRLGYVAGWGAIQELPEKLFTTKLKETLQEVLSRKDCLNYLKSLPNGTICAGKLEDGTGYTSSGDSGNALIMNKAVQVGVVAYKVPMVRRTLTVHMDVAYYYEWIKDHALRVHCAAAKINKRFKKKYAN